MKKGLFLFCFLVSALAAYVQSKPHGKNQHVKHKLTPKEQSESVKHHDSKDGFLPTFLPFESSTQDSEDEDMSEENESRVEMKQVGAEELEGSEEGEKNTPLLLSDEALTQLLQVPEEVDEPVEEDEDDDDDSPEKDKETKEMQEEGKKDGESTMKNEDGTEKEGENKLEIANETDSSTESEIPMDLDYAADRDASQPLTIKLEEAKVSTVNTMGKKMEETAEDVIPSVTVDYDSQQSDTDSEDIAEEQDVPAEQTQDELKEPFQVSENDNEKEKSDQQDEKNSTESEATIPSSGKKAKKQKNESKSHGKDKAKKQRNNQKPEKMQSDQASTMEATEEHTRRKDQGKLEEPTENTEPKPRKKNGKWTRLVGMNPVQIRATMELYPDIRPTHRPSGQGLPADPCENFRCKRGKTCKMNDDNKPVCVCQEPSECPPSVNDLDHVCGTDNKTYDTSCQLFATKCGLEGTKIGHRLHLDYTGSCKFIPPCPESELVQFPLRMRDWLKNVLLQLYEHESMSPGFLTAKQRIRVQKIYESERRLHAGDHPVELLQQDFEKNYNMYIYPVHWQFAQMDQHPSDRFLSHSELAPLRVPLVPMEHCTSVFFQRCDADKDKLVSFKEWCSCFGIKEEDMDTNLLF
ncbi:SPARC-like protein 1 [Sinocyclocheilus grahami]|uniref:SPARC-like protein 1 n=1 Tax=Sinocyclocheilus grahami TaxID=75366 RepID=A0A672KCB5_SINGR|nr:PREDICTED: SPARC-like protein 1 [Sinocyclocheilus grahami]